MRENARDLLREVQRSYGPLFILYRSKPQAVLLSLKEYEKLADLAEDYIDSLEAQEYETQKKRKIDWISLKDVKNKFK